MTIYKNEHGSVEFLEDDRLEPFNKYMVNLSGGTDSALGLWMLAKELQGTGHSIQLSTLVDSTRPTNLMNASEVRLYVQEQFPNVDIEPIIENRFTEVVKTGDSKVKHHNLVTRRLRNEGIHDLLLHCRTRNPLPEEAKAHDLVDLRETIRDIPEPAVRISGTASHAMYSPFIGVDKKWIAAEYKKHDLTDLFNLTASCISYGPETEYFTKACRACWWCKEKLWAFGCYDYGEK